MYIDVDVVGIVDLVELTFSPTYYLKTEMSRPQRRLRRPAPRCENVLEQSLERASKHGFNCFEKLGNVPYWLTQSDRSTPLEVTAFFGNKRRPELLLVLYIDGVSVCGFDLSFILVWV